MFISGTGSCCLIQCNQVLRGQKNRTFGTYVGGLHFVVVVVVPGKIIFMLVLGSLFTRKEVMIFWGGTSNFLQM